MSSAISHPLTVAPLRDARVRLARRLGPQKPDSRVQLVIAKKIVFSSNLGTNVVKNVTHARQLCTYIALMHQNSVLHPSEPSFALVLD